MGIQNDDSGSEDDGEGGNGEENVREGWESMEED